MADGKRAAVTHTLEPCGVDVYPRDHPCDWDAYIAAGWPWCFAIFKLTEGLDFQYDTWAAKQRKPFLASDRYGIDLFDGFYHYLRLHQDGRLQADRFWLYMQRIGGERSGTLPAMVDVERGGQVIANPTRAMVEDCTEAFAMRYRQLSGREATLYGGELLRSCGVHDRLGCGRSAVALYGPRLGIGTESTAQFLARTGTDLAHTMLWQYRSTDSMAHGPPGYPMTAPGCGPAIDINALILPGGLPAVRDLM